MKLRYTKQTTEEITTDIPLPVYFYFQDDGIEERHLSWDGKRQIVIENEFYGRKISVFYYSPKIELYHIENNLTSAENFEQALSEALNNFKI